MTSAGARKPLPARSLVEFPAYSFIPTAMDKITHFGYKQVAESEKAAKVAEVFHSVAAQYDVMNDLMSAGLHRLWKRFAVAQAGLRPGMKVLDVAGGTADLTRLFLKEVGETGTVLVLEFSKVWKPLEPAYDLYSFKLLPLMGKLIAQDADSYQYLAESIRMHPGQEALKTMMETAGFAKVSYHNLTAGVVALHKGFKV